MLIPLPRNGSDDVILRGADKKGIFSIKSAYHLGMEMFEAQAATTFNSNRQSNRWKHFWKTNVGPKIKIACWKIVQDIIPLKCNLRRKGILTDNVCSFVRITRSLRYTCSGNVR